MTVKSAIAVAVLALAVALTAEVDGAQQSEKPGDGSDARQTFTISYGLTEKEEDALQARARRCVWENWRRKRPARCLVIRTNLEGEPTIQDFYVDRSAGGEWRVFLEVRYECCWHSELQGKERKTESKGTFTYRIVERMDVRSQRVVPEKEDRPAHTYVLRFRENASAGDDAATQLIW